jgi:hypothetical protein
MVLEKSIVKPDIKIINSSGGPITTLYIKSHLRYMIHELLQTALESTISSSTQASSSCPRPTLLLMIASGKEDISFRVTREEEIFTRPSSSSSTVASTRSSSPPSSTPTHNRTISKKEPKISLAKLIAKYWGGDIETVKSGHTYSSYLHLSVKDCQERIPPILETMPMDLLQLIMNGAKDDERVAPALAVLKK